MGRMYERQLRQAFEEAPLLQPADPHPNVEGNHDDLRHVPEDMMGMWNGDNDIYTAAPGEVLVEELDELVDLSTECIELFPEYDEREEILRQLIQVQWPAIYHEGQHRTAARMQRVRDSVFGISLYRIANPDTSRGYHYTFGPFSRFAGLYAPKLGIAAIVAYPTELSSGDRNQLSSLGYDDVEDLDQRIARYNRSHSGQRIPRPLSLRK